MYLSDSQSPHLPCCMETGLGCEISGQYDFRAENSNFPSRAFYLIPVSLKGKIENTSQLLSLLISKERG